jgi:hypothetical protein
LSSNRFEPQNSGLDEFFSQNADKLQKLNFTPKLNPRLKVIREEEKKFEWLNTKELPSALNSKFIEPIAEEVSIFLPRHITTTGYFTVY